MLCLFLAAVSAVDAKTKVRDLPTEFREWFEEVELLLTKEERKAFLALDKDYQRTAFVEKFWKARDASPATEQNEFRERFYARLAVAKEKYGGFVDERYKIHLLNGEPQEVFETSCGLLTWPLEIWRYSYSEVVGRRFQVIFYQPSAGGPFKIWRPVEGYTVLLALSTADGADFYNVMTERCAELEDVVFEILNSFLEVEREGRAGTAAAEAAPEPIDDEWLRSFRAASTDAPAGVEPMSGTLELVFPGRHQNRVIVEGRLMLNSNDAEPSELIDGQGYNFLLTGEVLLDEKLFETFRYQFNLPVLESTGERLDLVFERTLRPGTYELTLKVEDLTSGRYFRIVEPVEVPSLDGLARRTSDDVSEEEFDSETAAEPEQASIRITADDTELRSGLTRFVASTSGDGIRKVTFLLEGKPILTKTRPPYSVELDLGSLPTSRTVRVVAVGTNGDEVATDEIVVNPGQHVFQLRLVEPLPSSEITGSLRARAEVQVPDSDTLDRVELFLNETLLATLFQPPYVQSIAAPTDGSPFYVRAVAYLEDGNATEDLVLFNAGDYAEDIRVRLVELYVTVLDNAGRPVRDLPAETFSVREDGEKQELLRFEQIDNLPIYVSLLVDTSASMEPDLETVRLAARQFFEETIAPNDRASLITFSDQPRLAAGFTSDLGALGSALAGLRAERSTALYDSAIFALDFFKGIKGQKALLVLTDGKDRRSEYTYEQALEFAQHSEVAIYTIGLGVSGANRQSRSRLAELAEATGGRSFFIKEAEELGDIYAQIEQDLRSRYFLVYRSPGGEDDDFRRIDVDLVKAEYEAITRAGYYP